MNLAAPKRSPDCISDLSFDRMFAEESSADAKRQAEQHMATCARCSKRHAELLRDREVMLADHPWAPPTGLSGSVRHSSRRASAWAVAGLVAAAACTLLVYGAPDAPAVRLKGSSHIGFFVQRQGYSERAASGSTVRPGERIRFVYSNPRAAFLAIYGVDADGTVSRYYPEGDTAAPVAPGSDVLLDSAVELDGTLGHESVHAIFCDQVFAVSRFEHTLRSHLDPREADHCSVDTLSWTKEQGSRR